MSKANKVSVRGKVYDLNDAADLLSIQQAMVPENWPTKKADCVRLYISTSEMLIKQFRRHLAANWKNLCKVAHDEAEDGGKAVAGMTFKFEVDQSAPTVAAITKLGLAGSMKYGTTGKPQTHDLNQGDWFDEDAGDFLDFKKFEKEQAAEPPPPTPENSETPPDPTAGGDVTPENAPGDEAVDKKKRKRKK